MEKDNNDICEKLASLTIDEFAFIEKIWGFPSWAYLDIDKLKSIHDQLDGDGKHNLKSLVLDIVNDKICTSNKNKPLSIKSKNKNCKNTECGYIYLLRTREFIRLNEQTYKIGKTRQKNLKRFDSYPKKSELMLKMFTPNVDADENMLIDLFKSKYKHMTDYGREYFNGDVHCMIDDIEQHLGQYSVDPHEIVYSAVSSKTDIADMKELVNATAYPKSSRTELDEYMDFVKHVSISDEDNYIYGCGDETLKNLDDFISHIQNDKPDWYIVGKFIPKMLIVEKFNERYDEDFSVRTFMSILKKHNMKNMLMKNECLQTYQSPEYGYTKKQYRGFFAKEI